MISLAGKIGEVVPVLNQVPYHEDVSYA